MSEQIYEFDAWAEGVEGWSTNPGEMVDGVETDYASTTTDGDIQKLTGNECVGTDLGTISKVELRFYGYSDVNDQCILRPVFGGSADGDNHIVVPGVSAAWKAWQDITSDSDGPADTNFTEAVYGVNWRSQTFTPSATGDIAKVGLLLYRSNSPGTIAVSIRATDGEGKPTGLDLTSGETDGDTLTTNSAGEFRLVDLTSYELTDGTKYAIVVRAVGGDASNAVWWRKIDADQYAGGQLAKSNDSGDAWALEEEDFAFWTDVDEQYWWAWSDVQNLDCDVEQNDVSKGNTMYVGMVQIQVTYTAVAGWTQLQYASEPPTPNAWNQLKQEAGPGFVKLLLEGE